MQGEGHVVRGTHPAELGQGDGPQPTPAWSLPLLEHDLFQHLARLPHFPALAMDHAEDDSNESTVMPDSQ